MRAVSVLAVLLYHLNPALLPGGFIGVDVFFVISGFVVTRAMLERPDRGFGRFALSFYRRRLLRIVPALLFFLLTATLLAVLFIPSGNLSRTNDLTALAAFFGFGNVALWLASDDYFSLATDFNPFTHTWSLGVEEQFYLLFPAVMFLYLTGRTTARRWTSAVAALCALSLVFAAVATTAAPDLAFYMLPFRFWELGLGALLAVSLSWTSDRIDRLPAFAADLGVAAALALLGVALVAADPGRFPFPWALAPVVACLIVIACVARREGSGLAATALASPAMVYVGRLSYSLYLWHFAIIVLMRWTVGIDRPDLQGLAACLSLACAAVSYHLVERPLRFSPQIAVRPDSFVVMSACAATLVAAAVAASLMYAQPVLSLSRTSDESLWGRQPAREMVVDGCLVGREETQDAGVTFFSFRPRDCAQGAGNRIAVIGESHALSYQTMMQSVAGIERTPVDILYLYRCQPFPFRDAVDTDRCSAQQKTALAWLADSLSSGDVLVLAGLRITRFRDTGATEVRENADLDLAASPAHAAAAEAAFATLKPLLDKGVRIIVEAPKPLFRAAPFRCVDWFTRHSSYCAPGLEVDRGAIEERRAAILGSMAAFAAMHPAISIWDPLPTLCPGPVCSAFADGKPLYSDGDHLTKPGNDLLLPDFVGFLRASSV